LSPTVEWIIVMTLSLHYALLRHQVTAIESYCHIKFGPQYNT